MLAAIAEADALATAPPREKLSAIAGFIVDSYRHDPELMKVIIVEVTRAANTFGRTHLAKIRDAYALIAAIVAARPGRRACSAPRSRPSSPPRPSTGSIEQVLTGWIFDSDAVDDDELERAKTLIVETICRGLERGSTASPEARRRASLIESADDDWRALWSSA